MIEVFIDGANLYASCKALGLSIDFKLLKEWFEKKDQFRMNYYTAILPNNQESNIIPLLDYLSYNGYSVVKKDAKEWTDTSTGRKKIKGNMDIEMAVDMLSATRYAKHIFLFSGDGDFTYLIEACKKQGAIVTVISTIQTEPVMIADELRRTADVFVELTDLPVFNKDAKSKWTKS